MKKPQQPPVYDVVVTTRNARTNRVEVVDRVVGLPARAAAKHAIAAQRATADSTTQTHVVTPGAGWITPLMTCSRGVGRRSAAVQSRDRQINLRKMLNTQPGTLIRVPITCIFAPTSISTTKSAFERALKTKPKRRAKR